MPDGAEPQRRDQDSERWRRLDNAIHDMPPERNRAAPRACGPIIHPGPAAYRASVVRGLGHRVHDVIEVEAAGLLPRRVLPEALQPLAHHRTRGRDEKGAVDAPLAVAHALVV